MRVMRQIAVSARLFDLTLMLNEMGDEVFCTQWVPDEEKKALLDLICTAE